MITLFDQEKVMEVHDYYVAETARKDGVQEGTLKSIQNLIKNLVLSADRAMEALGLSDAERSKYVEMLKQQPVTDEDYMFGYTEEELEDAL